MSKSHMDGEKRPFKSLRLMAENGSSKEAVCLNISAFNIIRCTQKSSHNLEIVAGLSGTVARSFHHVFDLDLGSWSTKTTNNRVFQSHRRSGVFSLRHFRLCTSHLLIFGWAGEFQFIGLPRY
jgi:hypothetical protein